MLLMKTSLMLNSGMGEIIHLLALARQYEIQKLCADSQVLLSLQLWY